MRELDIKGTWVFEPKVFGDERGSFHEWFKAPALSESLSHRFDLAQANCSVSRCGTLRGLHYAAVPPGQAKYVKCVRGAILDVIVDIRVGSPTYKKWQIVRLDDTNHNSVYLAEGLGHGFMALTDDATVVYLCSEGYAPQREHGINPFDPDLAITWPDGLEPVLSRKDATAPNLADAEADGLLPNWEACRGLYAELRQC